MLCTLLLRSYEAMEWCSMIGDVIDMVGGGCLWARCNVVKRSIVCIGMQDK